MGSLHAPFVANEGGYGKIDASKQEGGECAIYFSHDEESKKLLAYDHSKKECWEEEIVGTCSFWQATTNTVALLFGMGMLAVPYAAQQGGWTSLSLLLVFAAMSCYTGYLLGKCMKLNPQLLSYQDIAGSAIGMRGRFIFTLCLYVEILACLIGFAISIGDNLAQLFPALDIQIFGLHLKPSQFLLTVSLLIVSPTVLMRDLALVSYLSLGGVVSSLVVVGAVVWTGVFGGVGFTHTIPALQFGKWPLIVGLYAFCYSGQVIIPNIYSSMKDPSRFTSMLLVSFTIATIVYGGLAVMGAVMFGDQTLALITLNIPRDLTVGTVVLWTTVVTPLSKFSLGIAPIALELEGLLPFSFGPKTIVAAGSVIRLGLLFLILCVAIGVPYFGLALSFIGSAISIGMSVIFPCVFYLILHRRTMSKAHLMTNVLIIVAASAFAVIGTWSSATTAE
ncbi:solute carrier family 32 (vesicular inhibitory amino acid transporter) [Marchantia polymorpha subsp. ruderalis]